MATYWIYYRMKADAIQSVTVVHCRQEQPQRVGDAAVVGES
ncbi:MAG TPA: hypothetical protein VFN13_01135 [Rudaea sp.]|nr:hypothetical protein [Rudaea sp.]